MLCSCTIVGVALLITAPALADNLFRISEVVVEQEISPRQASHTVRWEGDYYVSDRGVSLVGWGHKATKEPIPYDKPHAGVSTQGSAYTSSFSRLEDGLVVKIEYSSFTLERVIRQTGPRTCTDAVTLTLQPGHDLFEVHRISNHEPMLENSRKYVSAKCEVPPLLG